jgi:pimeloyl-ACP methyl ester carboxylesterase
MLRDTTFSSGRSPRAAALISASLVLCWVPSAFAAAPVKNVVLVHGAWVDGSGWRPVSNILVRDGYDVSIVQEPLTSVADDVAATQRILDRLNGPCVLVGHSYGGAVITEAGRDPHVVALVYVAAHALDEGETEKSNGERFPAPGRDATRKTPDGFTFLDPARYRADFAADVPQDEAAFEARSQALAAGDVFTTPATQPAWKAKPSWYAVATADRIINPDLERMYAARAHSHTVEVNGASHSVYRSRPREVAALIEDAAKHAGDDGR